MDFTAVLLSQLTDVFRIGLLAGLIYTTERTKAQTGVLLPLAIGVVFVAVILATTIPKPDLSMVHAVTIGSIANAIIVAILWAAYSILKKRQ